MIIPFFSDFHINIVGEETFSPVTGYLLPKMKRKGKMQMIDFKTIRAAVPTIQAAKDYGLDVGRHGMARCPFHDDHSPSLKLDDRFYCFGCGASGDVIDFTARYFGISLQSAAEKLCRDYGLSSGDPLQIQSRPNIRKFREDELLCIHTLGAYRKLLEDWKERYVPQPDSDIWDLRFCEALKALSTVDHLLDCLTIGTLEQRVAMVDSLLVSIIPEMQERLRKEDNAHGRADQSGSGMGGRQEN